MTVEIREEHEVVAPGDLSAARAATWAEHQRRCIDNEPDTGAHAPSRRSRRGHRRGERRWMAGASSAGDRPKVAADGRCRA